MFSKTISCIVRGTQTLFAIFIIALVGNMISNSGYNMVAPVGGFTSNNHPSGGNPAEVNFAMFLGVWTLLTMLMFVPFALKSPSKDEIILIALTALDGLTTLFYMSGGIALAAAMGIHSCANSDYVVQNRITNNAYDQSMRCREAQATTAFVWFNFLIFVATTVFSARALYMHSHPSGDIEDSPDASEVSGGPAVADFPRQPATSGMNRFWGHRTVTSTGGPAVAEVSHDDSHNWRRQRATSIESGAAPEVDDGQSYRS